jgi:hypothetical protein
MLHWQNETYFGRRQDGSVRILKFAQPMISGDDWPDADGVYEGAEIDLTILDDHWGSIVASVSHAGEENRRWYQAMEFHNGKSPTEENNSNEYSEQIGQLADKADNYLAATNLPMSAEFHLGQLKVGLKEISDTLKAVYEGITGIKPWN